MHHFPGSQIWKCMTTLASQPCHHPSINQLLRHAHKNSDIMRMAKYAERMSCHLLSNIQLRGREIVRNRLRAEELNTTPHQTCPKIRWRLSSAQTILCSSFLFIWSSLGVCGMSDGILLHFWGQMATGATIWKGRGGGGGEEIWRCWRNRRNWQMKKWYL